MIFLFRAAVLSLFALATSTMAAGSATITAIVVTPARTTIAHGSTIQFEATATMSDGSFRDVTAISEWKTSHPEFATVTATGLATGVGYGASNMAAKIGAVTGATILSVTGAGTGTGTGTGNATIKTITVTPARTSIALGSSLQFAAIASMSDGTTKDVTSTSKWTTSHPEFVTINATGLARGVGWGASNMAAKNAGVTGATILAITKATNATVKSVAVTPANASLAANATLQYTAIATLSDGTTNNVTASATWASSATGIATISAVGLARALAAGTSSISAAIGSIKSATTLTVAGTGTAVIKTITVTPARTSIALGSSLQFTAIASMSDGTTKDVTSTSKWTTSHPEFVTINATGLARGVGWGASNMAAKNAGVTGATILSITKATNATVKSVAVTPANASLAANATLQYTAIATLSDATTSNVTSSVTWKSSSPAAAIISAGGLLTGVASGVSTVSAVLGSVSGATGVTVQAGSSSHTDVLTYKNNLSRTGLNSTETQLTIANLNSAGFGLKFHLPVDGLVFAQPLYVSQLSINGGLHNVVFIVTEHNSAYAYDSDNGGLLWRKPLNVAGETSSDNRDCDQVSPEIGVTATPVIDRTAGTAGAMYIVAMSKDSGSVYHQRVHALDLATGAEIFGGPREVQATYTTSGGGTTSFDPGAYKERAGLLLLNGEVYTSWTSHCDDDPYTGWIIAYDGATLNRTRVFNIAPNSKGLGPSIWMSGGAPAVDSSGFMYILAAQGAFETTLDAKGFPNLQDYGNSFLKISTANHTMAVADYFTMWNEVSETNADLDLGGGGAMLLPDQVDVAGAVKRLAIGAGKDAIIYVVDRDSLGGFNPSKNNIWQEVDGAMAAAVRSTPAYFDGHVYLSDRDHSLKSFTISAAKLPEAPTSQTATTFIYPGTSAVVSANGTSNGIVWAAEATTIGVLHAYDANNLAIELYNSKQAANGRDSYGAGNKYPPVTVADGKVFVVSKTEIAVFGLLH